ncbi:trypsin-like peptidase, partial [Rhizobium subbaraonis]
MVLPTRTEIRRRAVWILEHAHGEWAQGSAFFLKDVGLVTAAHCVQDAIGEEIDVYHPTKPANIFKVKVKKHHIIRGLALLEHSIPSNEFYELEMTNTTYVIGDVLTAAGYPGFAPGDGLNERLGHISSFSVKSGVPLIEVADSGLKPAGIPINYRPPFRFEAGHYSNQLPA